MKRLLLIAALWAAVQSANAATTTLNFDEFTVDLSNLPTLDSYQGLQWQGWAVFDAPDYQDIFNNTYNPPSLENFVINNGGLDVATVVSATRFDFLGASVSTFALNDDFDPTISAITLEIDAYRGAMLVGNLTIQLSANSFNAFTVDYSDIDRLEFRGDAADKWWALDDFQFESVPVPESPSRFSVLGALALLAVAGWRGRK